MSTKTHRSGTVTPVGKGRKGGKGRGQIAAMKATRSRNWGPILMFSAVGLVAALILGFGFFLMQQRDDRPWQERAADIEGLVNYRQDRPEILTNQHFTGPIDYPVNPPVGGDHNGTWQQCNGMVYDAPIPSEHAVHSMEHGAVWITYRPDLPADQVNRLADRVRNRDYLFMSPFEGLDAPISLQAWGFQLKVDNARDSRVDEFIRALRINATQEVGATCQGGNVTTGEFPIG
jgi:hypothetical protein